MVRFLAAWLWVGAASAQTPPTPVGVLYQNDFAGVVGSEWSATSTAVTPRGARRFLGQFGNQTITLSLSNLPAHNSLTLGVDLFLINTWDGSGEPGPDHFDVRVVDGPSLLHSSFANSSAIPQAYPGPHRSNDWPGYTGALEVETLGYQPDSVYHLQFTFAHVSSSIQLEFQGSGLQGLTDESWGLDNLILFADGPNVVLTSPATGSAFTTPTNIVLNANVPTGAAVLHSVEFLANGVLLGTVSSPPFTLVWSNPVAGVDVLMARAIDETGRSAVSQTTITVNGLAGEYFNNTNLTGTPVLRRDPGVNFNWNTGQPYRGGPGDRFSVKWTGVVLPKYSEPYTFFTTSDDGVRLWIDGSRIIDEWHGQPATVFSNTVTLEAGREYVLQMNYYENGSKALAMLEWQSARQDREVIPASQLFPPRPGFNRAPNMPVISQPATDGWVVDPFDNLVLSVDFFSDPDTGQSHLSTDWEINTVSPPATVWVADNATGSNRLTNRLSNGVFVGSHQGLTRLLYNTDYVLRVRHRDSSAATNAWSNWGERLFNTRPPGFIGPPFVTSPYTTNIIVLGDTVVLDITATNIEPQATYQWQFQGSNVLGATNRTLSLSNFSSNQVGAYRVVVGNAAASNTSPALALMASYLHLCGTVWNDRNADGVFNSPLIRGEHPTIVLVVDRSHSTVTEPYIGEPVGDINGDAISNSRLDAELAAFIALNNELIARGFSTQAQVAIVAFGETATVLDLNPVLSGTQQAVAPNADANSNGVNDVEEALRGVRITSVAGTDYHLALLSAFNLFVNLGATNDGNLIFLSDGESDREGFLYTNDVAALKEAGVHLRAFGAGSNAVPFLSNLQLIDSNAEIFTAPEDLVEFFGGPTGSLAEAEPGLADVVLYVDLNNNGQLDAGEPTAVSRRDDPSTLDLDESGTYCFDQLMAGPNVVRVVGQPLLAETYPLEAHVVDLSHDPFVTGLDFGLARRATLGLAVSPAGGVEVTVARPGGVHHRIEASPDLLHWTTVTNVSGTNPVVVWMDPAGAIGPKRFYRAVQR
jgi:hypothetical protein